MCDTRCSLAIGCVYEDQVVTIGDRDRVSIRKQKIGDAFVRAFVAPENSAGVDVDSR